MPQFVLDTGTFSLFLKGHPQVCVNLRERPLSETTANRGSTKTTRGWLAAHWRQKSTRMSESHFSERDKLASRGQLAGVTCRT